MAILLALSGVPVTQRASIAIEQRLGVEQLGEVGLAAARIASRVVGTVDGWQPGAVFALANGRQWTVLKGSMTLRKPMQDPQVVLVPGVAVRWFLQIDEDLPKRASTASTEGARSSRVVAACAHH